MAQIHVCYSKGDGQETAGEIVRFLRARLGEERISHGADDLETMPADCDWLLVVIGPRWVGELAANAPLVRALAAALRGSTRIIPLLVEGAVMPPADQWPAALRELARRQPLALTPERWAFDLERLLGALLGPVAGGGPPPTKSRPKALERFRPLASPPAWEMPKMAGPNDEEGEAEPTKCADEPVADAPLANEPEPVLLGAAAPAAVKPGGEFTAHFVAYVKAQEAEVRRLLEQHSPRSKAYLGAEACRWRHGLRVKVRLRGRELRIDPPEQEFVWIGGRNLLPFDVEVPADAPEETIVLKFDVLIDEVVVARLRMDLDISAKATDRVRRAPAIQPASTAFASYSSIDRSRVLDRVDALKTNAGIDFFMDCIDLHEGEEWKPALAEAIHRQELFMLFWSRSSAASPWVDWELETAKQVKSRDFIQIQALQPDFPPPKGFESIHGGSVYLWVREGNEAVRNRPTGS